MSENEKSLPSGHAFPLGKIKLRERISDLFPAHEIYVEPFAGDLSAFLSKPRSKAEVLNDEHGELAGFFRYLRIHRAALLAEINAVLAARVESDRARGDVDADTEIGRAVGFFFRRIFVPGEGAVLSRAFTVRARLSRVCIEAKPPLEVIRFFDSQDTLFFVDIPREWSVPVRLAELRDILAGCSGRWIVVSDSSSCLKVFSEFRAIADSETSVVFSKNFNAENETRFPLSGRKIEAA